MRFKFVIAAIILFPLCLPAQRKFTISGFISDSETSERLIGATISVGENRGAASNQYGFYSITLPEGVCRITCSYVGYKTIVKTISLNSDTIVNLELQTGMELAEVEVKGKRREQNEPQLSSLNYRELDLQELGKAPVILGERDILKTLQYFPGIKSGRENTAGYNVRGGSSDQNLILLDGVPVYNVNHLFGFFSVFNSDAIKHVSLFKGGIPARYGGRLSSVLDISMKEGDMKESHGVFSISPVSARITYEAPIKKDTSAFIVSFRRTLVDIPMVLFLTLTGNENKYGYYFYDFNAKTNWIFNPKNRLYLSIYAGQDKQFNRSDSEGTKNRSSYNWGNITTVLRWNLTFSPKLFSNISAYYSKYRLNNLGSSKSDDSKVVFKADSELQDYCVKTDFDYYLNPKYTLRFGAKYSYMIFSPNIVQLVGDDYEVKLNEEQKNRSNNWEGFLENSFQFGRLNLNAGLRGTSYNTGQKTYWSYEPRLALRYNFNNDFSLNASYTRMSQFIHLLSNSSLGMPTDLWVASTDKVAPQKSSQVSFGAEKQFTPDVSFGIEGYYKWMNDVIRFEEGAVFLGTQDSKWYDNISVGEGRAYGVEFVANKTEGKVTGMISYTLAWSERQFDDVNRGRWFPDKYDRRHDLSFLGEYHLNKSPSKEKSFSVGFTMQSGNNISMPDSEFEGIYLPGMQGTTDAPEWVGARQTYDNPNNLKMPTFHHLDIGYNAIRKKSGRKSYTWSFSVYNVYNRMNPWYYYKKDGKVKQVSIFPIIPSVGFKYMF